MFSLISLQFKINFFLIFTPTSWYKLVPNCTSALVPLYVTIGPFITLVMFCLPILNKKRLMFVQYCERKWTLSVLEKPVSIILVSDMVNISIFWSFMQHLKE